MSNEYKANMLEALRTEMLELVGRELTPKARRYGYSDVSLESFISWKPIVLVLGNYSSGKSTLINELLEMNLQATGQAPTDDSFTVITGAKVDSEENDEIETRDGKAIINDAEFPFEKFKRHGDRFSSHFKLKRVRSKLLDNLAIIDTPGMLDSISEHDRGYDYQEVISDFASIADLILVLFDPHKAGTVRESHKSLRDTLPNSTFEDRVIFVLNRVDECGSLDDLLRVYGTLCWNLSQMTGRKDIPRILLSYAPKFSQTDGSSKQVGLAQQKHLPMLDNQRAQLVNAIKAAPKARLDNMASFLESHALRLKWLIKGILEYKIRVRNFAFMLGFWGALGSMILGVFAGLYSYYVEPWGEFSDFEHTFIGIGFFGLAYFSWLFVMLKVFVPTKKGLIRSSIDDLVVVDNQHEKELWEGVKSMVYTFLGGKRSVPAVSILRRDLLGIENILKNKAQELRSAIGEVNSGRFDSSDKLPS